MEKHEIRLEFTADSHLDGRSMPYPTGGGNHRIRASVAGGASANFVVLFCRFYLKRRKGTNETNGTNIVLVVVFVSRGGETGRVAPRRDRVAAVGCR